MALRARTGRRAAPNQSLKTPEITLGGSAAKVAEPVADGEYRIKVTGARVVTSKSGSTSVILTVEDVENGQLIKVRPLLVASPGGDSDLTYQGRATLEALLGLDEGATLSLNAALRTLTGVEAEVELAEMTDHRGQQVNEIVEIFDTQKPQTKTKEG
jgi:hypothetical protein